MRYCEPIIKAGIHNIKFAKRALIMGILNLTPDSFSKDGLLRKSPITLPTGQAGNYQLPIKKILETAQKMADDGADILDIGGESTRPGARPITADEEIKRVIPAIKALSKKIKLPISVDTYKHKVAEAALDNGASIINDISALSDKKMPEIIKKHKAAVVLMHMKGKPLYMQDNPRYKNLIAEIMTFLKKRIKLALDSGINHNSIIIDPGIGFGKTLADNLEIIRRLGELKKLKLPLLVGPSRKSFIGKILDKDVFERVFGTAAIVALSVGKGADILRVHDVKEMSDVVKIASAVNQKTLC